MQDDPNEQPREWPMPKRTMSLKTFRDLLRRREQAVAHLRSQPSPTTSTAVDTDIPMEPEDGVSDSSVELHSSPPSGTTSTAVATNTPIETTVTEVGGGSSKDGDSTSSVELHPLPSATASNAVATTTPMDPIPEGGGESSKDGASTSSVETEKSGAGGGNSKNLKNEGIRRVKPRIRRCTKEFLRFRSALLSGTPPHELWRDRLGSTNEDEQKGSRERQKRLKRSSSKKHTMIQAVKRLQEVEERFNSQTSGSFKKKFGEVLLLSYHINRLCAMSSYPIARKKMFPHINQVAVSRRPPRSRTNIGLSRFSPMRLPANPANFPTASTPGTGSAATESEGTSEPMDNTQQIPET